MSGKLNQIKSELGDTDSLSDRELRSSWRVTRRLCHPIQRKATKCWRI